MFDHLLRGLKDRLLTPLATLLRGVPPNVLSLIALLLGLSACSGGKSKSGVDGGGSHGGAD